jgi:DNA polymerase delta subunit 1
LTASDELLFQQIDIDYHVVREREGGGGGGDGVVAGMPGITSGPRAVLRLYGVTKEGYAVLASVHGFVPYFYVPRPADASVTPGSFMGWLDSRMRARTRTQTQLAPRYCVKVEEVEKKSILGYVAEKSAYWRVYMALPAHVAGARAECAAGGAASGSPVNLVGCNTLESDMPFVLRFMIDKGIVGMSWIRLPAGAFHQVSEGRRQSRGAAYEVDVAFDKLEALSADTTSEQGSSLAPLRILSFDIECMSSKGFPSAERDAVIQIASVVNVLGQSAPLAKQVLTLNTCAPIAGAEVRSFRTERELMLAFQAFVRSVDPDILTGYNICNFDLPYLIDRASALKIDDRFNLLGRLDRSRARVKDAKFSSKAYGTRESKETVIEGRVTLDVLQVMQRDYKLRAYSLNAVSDEFLGEQKEDVHHSIISTLQAGHDEDRRRLAVYCLKDALLPLRLMEKLMIVYNYIEMSRVMGVPMSFLLSRGQAIKVISQLYRKAAEEDMLIPYYKSEFATGNDDIMYEGATVLEPVRGFHNQPIATLDFASLYPSIMMAHNLCYSTLLTPEQAATMDPSQYAKTPRGDAFVLPHVKPGVLPRIFTEVLAARKRAKADLKREKDPFKRAVLDGRQLALKISANSVYGFTGATVGKLPCMPVSAGTTAYGREMIDQTKSEVERLYPGARVIYGDTDSVMVDFGTSSLEESMRLGEEAAEKVTAVFTPPIRLEFEKVYFPYLLINKKRYAGLLWTRPEKWDKMDFKGIETVRRDNSLLVKYLITEVLKKILMDRDVEGAQALVRQTISELVQNKLDLSMLVISKQLSKDASEYDGKQAHTELAEKMRKRDPSSAPNVGDRVPYVIVRAAKGAKAYEKAEDPLYVLANDIPIDYEYYVYNQLRGPLMRIFEPIMANPESLLHGDHTKKITLPTPKQGGIVGFAVKREMCLGCKAPLSRTERSVCSSCAGREAEIYLTHLQTTNTLEEQFNRVWTQCQECQGSFHQTVLCTSRDCPIFYARHKVQKDLQSAQKTLAKFSTAATNLTF